MLRKFYFNKNSLPRGLGSGQSAEMGPCFCALVSGWPCPRLGGRGVGMRGSHANTRPCRWLLVRSPLRPPSLLAQPSRAVQPQTELAGFLHPHLLQSTCASWSQSSEGNAVHPRFQQILRSRPGSGRPFPSTPGKRGPAGSTAQHPALGFQSRTDWGQDGGGDGGAEIHWGSHPTASGLRDPLPNSLLTPFLAERKARPRARRSGWVRGRCAGAGSCPSKSRPGKAWAPAPQPPQTGNNLSSRGMDKHIGGTVQRTAQPAKEGDARLAVTGTCHTHTAHHHGA